MILPDELAFTRFQYFFVGDWLLASCTNSVPSCSQNLLSQGSMILAGESRGSTICCWSRHLRESYFVHLNIGNFILFVRFCFLRSCLNLSQRNVNQCSWQGFGGFQPLLLLFRKSFVKVILLRLVKLVCGFAELT